MPSLPTSKSWALHILRFCPLLNFPTMAHGVTRLLATMLQPAALVLLQIFSILLIICINMVLELYWIGYLLISLKMERLLATSTVRISTNMPIPARENINNGVLWSLTMVEAR